MKKFIAAILLLTCSVTAVTAQSFHFGLKGGTDLHRLDGPTFEGQSFDEGFRFGFHVGAFAEIGFPLTKIGLQPEVYLSQVNAKTANNLAGIANFGSVKNIKLSYINIPVLLNLRLIPMLSLQAGPQFGILINKDNSLSQNARDAFRNGDIGIAGGLQLNLTKLKIYGRYVAGIKDVNNDHRDKWKNQTIHLGLGFRIF